MKKKLEADLISIAHRILKLKNKSDINQLYLETQKLYEKLAILKFVDENFDEAKPTIVHADIVSEIENIFEKEEEIVPEDTKVETPIAKQEVEIEKTPEPLIVEEKVAETAVEEIPEEIEETVEESVEEINEEPEIAEEPEFEEKTETVEEIKLPFEEISFTTVSDLKPIPDFKPAFELTEEPKEEIKEVVETKVNPVQIMFEDLGINYAEAQFVKVDSFEAAKSTPVIPEFKETKTVESVVKEKTAEPKTATLNEKLSKGFHVDLNDRIAFTKNLFGNSSEDYSRVLNQLLTFDTFSEAKEFIENMVKPDYNNWEGKDDYADRFLAIIEKKFS